MSDDSEPVRLEITGAIAHIVLNRPQVLNAINLPLSRSLAEIGRAVAADDSIRAVVISGAGRAFLAGGDIRSFYQNGNIAQTEISELIASFHEAINILTDMPKPVIAQVHGAVAGAGISLMLVADFVICAEATRLTLAYAGLGASTDGGASWSLPRIVGLRQALEIALLNPTLDAQDALRLGLINRVLPADELAAGGQTLAEQLASGPALAYGKLKRLIRSSFERSLADQLDEEATAYAACAQSADFLEGVTAFIEKRQTTFTGH